MGQLDAARGNLQTILDNLTSGVIVLDARGAIVLSNPGATRILRAPMAVHEGRLLSQVPGLEQFGEVVQEQFARSEEHTSELQSPCNPVCRLLLDKKTSTI